jgi:hypothetical protein
VLLDDLFGREACFVNAPDKSRLDSSSSDDGSSAHHARRTPNLAEVVRITGSLHDPFDFFIVHGFLLAAETLQCSRLNVSHGLDTMSTRSDSGRVYFHPPLLR